MLPSGVVAEETIVVGKAADHRRGLHPDRRERRPGLRRATSRSSAPGQGRRGPLLRVPGRGGPGREHDQYGVCITGTTSPENSYVIDGLSVNDPAFGVLGTPLSVEFVQDVNVITGGYMPEYGRATGGVLTAVTELGLQRVPRQRVRQLDPGLRRGCRASRSSDQGSVITGNTSLKAIGDFGADPRRPHPQGQAVVLRRRRPLVRALHPHPRVLGVRGREERRQLRRDDDGVIQLKGIEGTGFLKTQEIEGSQRNYFADQRSFQYMGKLTYLINSDHNLSLSVIGTPSTTGGLGKLAINARSGALPGAQTARPGDFGITTSDTNSTQVGLKYAGAMMDKKLLLDANFGWFHQVATTLPADGTGWAPPRAWRASPACSGCTPAAEVLRVRPERGAVLRRDLEDQRSRCPVNNYLTGGPAFLSDAKLDRYQAHATATYMLNGLGQHLVKAGVDAEFLSYDQTKAYGGGVFLSSQLTSTSTTAPPSVRLGPYPLRLDRLPPLRLPDGPGHGLHGAHPEGEDHGDHHRWLPAGQLVHRQPGDRQRGPALRHPGALRRQRRPGPHPGQPDLAPRRRDRRPVRQRSREAVRQLRPVLRVGAPQPGGPRVPR